MVEGVAPDIESPQAKTTKSGFEVVEKTLQILSITVVLTYISGYLVTSTFLNSYGITTDASEFLKARYLYVGFLYLLFLASVGMAFGFVAVCYNGARLRFAPLTDLGETSPDIKRKYIAVWATAGFCFATSEALQITFLNPHIFRGFILLQTGLLASFLFYQLTNARALHHPGWDQHRSIFMLRGWTVFTMTIFSVIPIIFLFRPNLPGQLKSFIEYHKIRSAVVFNSLLLWAFWCALPFFYTGDSLKRRLDAKQAKQAWWQGIGPKRAIGGAIIIFVPADFILFATYKWRWVTLQAINLFLAVAAMASIIFMSIAYSRDRGKNKQKLSGSEEWSIWLLRIATAGTLYVASTIGYANLIYPLVPFAKSGGDFTTSSVVRVHFHYSDAPVALGLAPDLKGSVEAHGSQVKRVKGAISRSSNSTSGSASNKSEPQDDGKSGSGSPPLPDSCQLGVSTTCERLIVLEESPEVVYFARFDDATSLIDGLPEADACGPRLWKAGILDPKGPYRPRLIAVSRQNIVAIEEIKAVSDFDNCR